VHRLRSPAPRPAPIPLGLPGCVGKRVAGISAEHLQVGVIKSLLPPVSDFPSVRCVELHERHLVEVCQGGRKSVIDNLKFEQRALEETLTDYAAEVDHQRERVARLERAIDEAVDKVPASMRAVIDALQALRGVSTLTATTIVAEVGELSRFDRAAQLMGYSGTVPSEHSSGGKTRRGGITKTGNSHLRRVLIEAAWTYRHRPRIYRALRARQENIEEPVKAIAWKAQHRLHRRYRRLAERGMPHQTVVTAVGRELLGFIWAIGVHIERQHRAASS
jgi:transposase